MVEFSKTVQLLQLPRGQTRAKVWEATCKAVPIEKVQALQIQVSQMECPQLCRLEDPLHF